MKKGDEVHVCHVIFRSLGAFVCPRLIRNNPDKRPDLWGRLLAVPRPEGFIDRRTRLAISRFMENGVTIRE